MDVVHLEHRNKEFFEPLYTMLSKITIPCKTITNNRRGFPAKHRAFTFGMTTGRFNGKTDLSYYSKKYPYIYDELMRIGQIICDGVLNFKSVHINNNVICPKHKDSKNIGQSVLVSFGDYVGGGVFIEGVPFDARYQPILFDGSVLEHWNSNDLVGNKYSLVFFT